MDFDIYKVTNVQYPERPAKPDVPKPTGVGRNAVPPTSQQFRDYADALDAYEKAMLVYREQVKLYQVEEARLLDLFRHDALEDVGLLNHPKAGKAMAFAWEHGHSDGLSSVHYWLKEVSELLED